MVTLKRNNTQVLPSLFLLVLLFVSHLEAELTGPDNPKIVSPASKRTEGRVTLEYYKNEEKIKYQLAFSEVVDTKTMRSKVSIGYVSYEPTVYYSRDGKILMVDKQAGCVDLRQMDNMFVPQLDWFIKLSYTDEELKKAIPINRRHHIGPTGLAVLLNRGYPLTYDHTEKHRNVECRVYSATYDRTKAKNIIYESLIPNSKMYDSNEIQIFAFRQTAKNIITSNRDKVSTILTVDYFHTEDINEQDAHQMDLLERDLNLPLGVGCTQFVAPTKPQAPASQSFIMTYWQNSLQSLVSLAYDHRSNYLRKEISGSSVGVWDMNEDLFYHVDQSGQGKLALINDLGTEVPLEECSVISLEHGNKQRSDSGEPVSTDDSILRPYKQSASSLDVLDFLGATSIYYMGLATVRDMPCLVYETVLSEPPKVFNLDLRVDLTPKSSSTIDYIVQYYIFKTASMQYDQPGRQIGRDQRKDRSNRQSSVPLIGDEFWPARIVLIKRDKGKGQTKVLDQFEIVDYHWGLFGLTKKPSELFMMPECFTDEQEQVSINFELLFASGLDGDEDKQKMLRHNKYKLEKDLVDDLFHTFDMSLLHLTEFELALRQRSVLASLVLSDRIEDKQLTYFGEGELPQRNSYMNNRISIQVSDKSDHGSESDCLLKAMHVSQVSLIIYCPRRSDTEDLTCTAIYGGSEPVIKRPTKGSGSGAKTSADLQSGNEDPLTEPTACRMYRLEPRAPPKSGTTELIKIRDSLKNHPFSFEMTSTQTAAQTSMTKPVTLRGMIVDFDVSHELQLISINNYKYALETKQQADGNGGELVAEKPALQVGPVRAFDTITYNNLGDCMRMCNLDPSCKSYSYCNDDKLFYGKCILASLDLRANNVEEQLVTTSLIKGKQVIVRDLELAKGVGQAESASEYKLELNSACNIYERDSLSMFVETDELVRIDESLQSQYMRADSAVECAHSIVELEASQANNYHSGMFAYCPTTGSCLLDERLFGSVERGSGGGGDDDEPPPSSDQGEPREILCQVYRKRYQTYFHVSPFVLKRVPRDEGEHDGNVDKSSAKNGLLINQMDLQFNTVEECAHACWESLGHACISFDYCLPQDCIVNLINSNATGSMSAKDLLAKLEYEPRTGCLHYERDLALDELRRANLIGHHKPLDLVQLDGGDDGSSRGPAAAAGSAAFWLNVPYYVAIVVLFTVGLFIGHKFDQRLLISAPQRPKHAQQSESGGGGGGSGFSSRFDMIRRFSSLARFGGADRRGSTVSRTKLDIEEEIYEDTSGIQMEEFGQRNDANADELPSRTNKSDSSVSPSGPSSSSATHRTTTSESNNNYQKGAFPGRIDVPNILL